MPDQAAGLRTTNVPQLPRLPGFAVTGGKGGVGKTCIAVNLAILLANGGLRPLLVDLDMGLANADIMLGVDPQQTLADVVLNGRPLESVISESAHGVGLIPAASGVEALANLGTQELQRLFLGLERLGRKRTPLILDTPAGIGREVIFAARAVRTVCVVLTPEPTALADAYALIKLLEQAQPGQDIRVVVNMARDQHDGMGAYTRMRSVAMKHLGRDLELLGIVPRDDLMAMAVRRRKPIAVGVDGPALIALKGIAAKLRGITWAG